MSRLETNRIPTVNQLLGISKEPACIDMQEGKNVLLADAAKIMSDDMMKNLMYYGGMDNV